MTALELRIKRVWLSEKRPPQAESRRIVSHELFRHDTPVPVEQIRDLTRHLFPHPLRGDAAVGNLHSQGR
jgi:hypothetical protein